MRQVGSVLEWDVVRKAHIEQSEVREPAQEGRTRGALDERRPTARMGLSEHRERATGGHCVPIDALRPKLRVRDGFMRLEVHRKMLEVGTRIERPWTLLWDDVRP